MAANSPRTTAKAALTRVRLLDAAASLFRERGYPASRLTDVAVAAGLGSGTVFYHFDSREDLAEAILALGQSRTTDLVERRLAQLSPDAGPHRRLITGLGAHLEAVLSSDAAAASIRIVGQVPAEVRGRQLKPQRDYAAILDGLIRAAQEADDLRSDLDVPVTRMFLLGGLNSTTEWFDARIISLEALTARVLRIVEDGIATTAGRRRLATPSSRALAARREPPAAPPSEAPDRTAEILSAAATVFRDQGFASARMSDVARLVGLHTGSLYYHVNSREDLVVRLLHTAASQWHDSVHHELDSLPGNARPIDRLATLIHAHLASALGRSDFTSAVLRVQHQLPPDIRQVNATHQRRASRVWRDTLRSAITAGQVRPDLDDQVTTMLLTGALNWTVEWFQPSGRLNSEDLIAQFSQLVFEGVVRR